MSTKIQQQQVQGLEDAIVSFNVTSGSIGITGRTMAYTLQGTGLNLANSIFSTGATLEAEDIALSGLTQLNANAITATGENLALDIAELAGALQATGRTWESRIALTGVNLRNVQVVLSGDIGFHSGRLDGVSGRLDHVSGVAVGTTAWPAGGGWTEPSISGNMITTGTIISGALVDTGHFILAEIDGANTNINATGVKLTSRIGSNPTGAAALGSGHFDNPGMWETHHQLYGEAAIIAQQNCATRIIQWFGIVDGGELETPKIQQLYLGGDKAGDSLALVPENAQWAVNFIGNAGPEEKADAGGDVGPPQPIGPHAYFLKTGLLISRGDDDIVAWQDRMYYSGVYGNSGAAGQGHLMKLIIVGSGQPNTEGHEGTYLTVSGYNEYTGKARFTATAYVSEMGPLYGGVSP